MKNTNRLLVSAAVALALGLPLTAVAADSGAYIGALVGYSSVDISKSDWDAAALDAFSSLPGGTLTSTSLDKNSTGYGVTVGYQFMKYVAIEAYYLDLGKAKGTATGTALNVDVTVPLSITGEFKSKGPAAAIVGILPFGENFAVDGRVGVYYGKTEVSLSASSNGVTVGDSISKEKSSLMAGIGASYAFNNNWSVRLDYMYFDKVGDKNTTGEANVNLAALGVRFQF
jgi:opacity protein-like surface antigen